MHQVVLPFPFQFLQCQNIIDVYEDIADLAGMRREALLPSSVATSAVKEQDPEKLLAAFRTAVEVVVKQVKPLPHADQHFANTTRNIITTTLFPPQTRSEASAELELVKAEFHKERSAYAVVSHVVLEQRVVAKH